MRDFGFTINIDKDSNFIIGHSEVEWTSLRNGSMISIEDDLFFYTITNKEKIFFIQDFQLLESKKITINGHYESFFLEDDILTITYKEYELLTLKNILNKGIGYKINDIISINGGQLSKNISDNSSQSTSFEVEGIDIDGGITNISIIKKGLYLQTPELTNNINGGHGSGAQFLLEYRTIESRKTLERQIETIEDSGHQTIITLNYALPDSIINGKISVEKWKAFLNSNYTGESRRGVEYHIIKDFTPNIKLPLLVKNSNKLEESYNHCIQILDLEILKLKQAIESLKNQK